MASKSLLRSSRSTTDTASHALLASFPGSSAWAERKEPGTHCLRMLSSPRISGNLEISVKSAPLHQPPEGMPTSPVYKVPVPDHALCGR